MTKQINVTQKHIDNGICSDAYNCPIALAILEQIDDVYEVEVNGPNITFLSKSLGYCKVSLDCDTSKIVEQFQVQFDKNKNVKPFAFELSFEEDDKDYYDYEPSE